MSRLLPLLAGSCFLLAAAGCGPTTGSISGAVTIDGQPLDKGVISFAPADGKGQAVTADVAGGRYSAGMPAGNKFVQISAPISVGKRKVSDDPAVPLDDIWDERLPKEFNAESKLEFEVKPGANTKDWETQSVRGKK